MSLPTPPNTSHREKENRVPLAGAHVIWSPHNQYRTINPIPQVPVATSASKYIPTKSILKKRSEVLLPLVDSFQRETTPEPPRPQFDPKYLSSPVATIINPSASLEDLIRAYSVLAARIRANVMLTADSDASWPILEPIRKHRVAFEDAVLRDLARCLIDPETMTQSPEDIEEEACLRELPASISLPSPKSSPKKKKGTTAKKAKYGRDLCTTCHSVIKLLGVVFTLPAVSGVFTVPQLRSILTQVLAIPLADDLPTPNARKTYALSIWLLQSQRLPSAVLENAADRIVFALRRGIEGELGKEGKKGSASDGLKAIHDLSVYQPSIFVPKFETLLPSVLANLLAPTLAIRAQACHALGGLARGLATLPVSSLHTRISAATVSYLSAVPASPARKSPTKNPSTESPLFRTVRTTLQATDAQHVSQGPVWALSVVASLLVLANSAVYTDDTARRQFIALLSLAMNHKKSTVRGLGGAVWRSATWAYCQPLLPGNSDDESEVEEEEDAGSKRKVIRQGREMFWSKVVATVVDMGVGLSTIVALLQEPECNDESLTRVSTILKTMLSKGGLILRDAIDVLAMMVSFEAPETEWNWNKLLPRGLFSASPGLLTADFTSLETPVRSIIAQCPDLHDVRSLTREEVAQPTTFDKLVEMWKECLGCLGLRDDDPVPTKILTIWENLIQANASILLDSEAPDTDIAEFALQAVEILVDILHDTCLDVTLKAGEVRFCTDGLEPTNNLSNAALKVKLVRSLWAVIRKAISNSQLVPAGEKFIYHLIQGEDEYTDSGEISRTEWATLCAEVLVVCDPDNVQEFWNYDGAENSKWEWTTDVRSSVWRSFVEKWNEEKECVWEAVLTLLAVPFTANKNWELSDSDIGLWETFLGQGVDKALDYGLEQVAVFDHVAAIIMRDHNPTSNTTSRVADALLSHLKIDEARELPETLFEFINDALRSSYPPEPRNKQHALWTLRTLARTIEICPSEYAVDLLRLIEEGLCTWISDEHQALSETEYAYDIVALYEAILMKISTLPSHIWVLESLGSILESAFRRESVPVAITDAFGVFWDATYGNGPVPDGGWPAEIQTCLGISPDEVDEFDDPWDKLSLSPPFRGEQIVSADGEEVPVGSPFSNARFNSVSLEAANETSSSAPQEVASVAQPCRPVTPTTPVTGRSRASTPPRPHKLPSTSHPSPTSPDSPLSTPYPPATPATPKRTPLRLVSGSKSSPNKRRKLLDNKENESPGPLIASVMERITASPRSGYDLAVSKKHVSPNHGEEERPSKRSKLNVPSLGGKEPSLRHPASESDAGDTEEERLVEFALVEREHGNDSPTGSFEVDEGPTPLSKKRKRFLLDAVEVPSVRQVYSRPKAVFTSAFATPSKQARVQTRSTSKPERRASSGNLPSSSRKRKWDNSDDPFNNIERSSQKSSELSSDDDVYFGQVTPYHVFSPALRRARDDDPPSSDDSNMSVSPTKGVVSRRLQKTGSGRLIPLSVQ
ncbi:hypothetical protein DFH07DRAFT_386505 [Mycena maculata]|uniref:Telomere-associated protein Rif1 N-terminal domain-containing protein n=1 Tax=Mycena maculata TaxID=230809 RepID=A0AAD7KAS1_9AGAR|nr:hypothetical protein DFH07DRAFT_386505 [Mycena maculata]